MLRADGHLQFMNRKNINKKGISAMVSTVLLIVFVVSLGLIVVNWSSRLVGKGVEQSKSKIGSSLECGDVNVRLEEKPGADSVIIIKNNNRNNLELKGFIARFFMNENVVVDYTHYNTEIKSFSAEAFPFEPYTTTDINEGPGVEITWSEVERVEIIPRVAVEDEVVNCDMKKVSWEK